MSDKAALGTYPTEEYLDNIIAECSDSAMVCLRFWGIIRMMRSRIEALEKELADSIRPNRVTP